MGQHIEDRKKKSPHLGSQIMFALVKATQGGKKVL